MSQQQAKVKRINEKTALRKDLETQISAGTAERARKLEASKVHLEGQLQKTSEKYLTVNGYMQARTVLEEATIGDAKISDVESFEIAREMSALAHQILEQVSSTDIEDISADIVEEIYDHSFVIGKTETTPAAIARELLRVQLAQNIGPSISDMISFRDETAKGIETLKAELEALNKPKKISE